ncbi:MAG: CDP-diacylglycerol--serine O-phosphatidyltransferase [Hyphomicrobiaceae bacterium]
MERHSYRMRRDAARRPSILAQRFIPIRYLVPNLATLMALCAGVTAIRAAIEARYELAVGLVVLAALLDGIDGRLARALNAQSRFGAELDSLADFVSFGVAPAVLIYSWGLGPLRGLGWIAVLVFACAASLRLARFNVALDEDRPKWRSNFFAGVPAPAGALAVMLPIYLEESGLLMVRNWPLAIVIYVMLMATLMVSTLPTYSGKLATERIASEYVAPALAGAALAIGLLVTYPYPTLATVTIVYLALIPLGVHRFVLKRRAWEASMAQARQSGPSPIVETGSPDIVQQAVPPTETRH